MVNMVNIWFWEKFYIVLLKSNVIWLVVSTYPSEKNDGVGSWDDEIPNIWKNKNMFQTTSQYDYFRWIYGNLFGVCCTWI
jgi:hypothetical protein